MLWDLMPLITLSGAAADLGNLLTQSSAARHLLDRVMLIIQECVGTATFTRLAFGSTDEEPILEGILSV